MALIDKLKEATLESISSAQPILFDVFARDNSKHIRYLLSEGILDNAAIDSALDKLVIEQAKKDYQHLQVIKSIEGSVEALHHCIPEYLAYAMSKPDFDKEFGSVDFEEAKSKQEFIQQYGRENIVEKLRNILLNPPLAPNTSSITRCADGGPCTC